MNGTYEAGPVSLPVAGPSNGQQGDPSFPNPNVQGNLYIYLAVYSSVPVYEMMVRGIGVMRRRSDSYLNATQILKVAGVDKGKRTKILEKDIALGVHEKVQGGYGRYQGTWIPFERAVELAAQFGVSHLLAPLFDYTPAPAPITLAQGSPGGAATTTNRPSTSSGGGSGHPISSISSHPQEGQSAATILSKAREQGLLPPDLGDAASRKRAARDSGASDDVKRTKLESNGISLEPNGIQLEVNGVLLGPNGITGTAVNGHTNHAQAEWKLRRSTKAKPQDHLKDAIRVEEHKTSLKNIFSLDPDNDTGIVPDLAATLPADIDPDTAIDDNEHTALHWAAALACTSIVQALVGIGADMFRGNNVGETPLIRAVLVTNNSDQDVFPRLLDVLGPTLRTVDDAGRTVLHHAALVAGVKGRASSARYYMECVLEYIARHEQSHFKELVDAQDSHGDTALNIAARIGNRGLVRILIEVGADKMKPNKLGLRPGDFGVETAELGISPAEDIVQSLRATPAQTAPVLKSEEVLTSISTMLSSLSSDFHAEHSARQEVLSQTRLQLRQATRTLAEQRNQIQQWRAKVAQVDEREQRVRNLEKALAEEDAFDWTGRTEIDGKPAVESAGPSFKYRGPGSTLTNLPGGITIEFDADPAPPPTDTDANSLPHLMRLQSWYGRVLDLLQQRIGKLEGVNEEQEGKLKKIVANCCGVEPEKIEGMLEGLLAALESDGSSLDMARVAGFLQKIKDRTISLAASA
ncbi:apses-domain-containing protein [Meredithblackwellia eburnea MCA 4105]